MENTSGRWQILKYPQRDGFKDIYRCERKRPDMNIIDSKTFRELSEASARCKELNDLLDRTLSIEPDFTTNSEFWCIMSVNIGDGPRFICYRPKEKSHGGRVRAEFDGLLFEDRNDASSRCRELNAPLLPELAKCNFMYGEDPFSEVQP